MRSDRGGGDRTAGKQSCRFSIRCDGRLLDRVQRLTMEVTGEGFVKARSHMVASLWGMGF